MVQIFLSWPHNREQLYVEQKLPSPPRHLYTHYTQKTAPPLPSPAKMDITINLYLPSTPIHPPLLSGQTSLHHTEGEGGWACLFFLQVSGLRQRPDSRLEEARMQAGVYQRLLPLLHAIFRLFTLLWDQGIKSYIYIKCFLFGYNHLHICYLYIGVYFKYWHYLLL